MAKKKKSKSKGSMPNEMKTTLMVIVLGVISIGILLGIAFGMEYIPWKVAIGILILAYYFYQVPTFNKELYLLYDSDCPIIDRFIPIYNEVVSAKSIIRYLFYIVLALIVVVGLILLIPMKMYMGVFSMETSLAILDNLRMIEIILAVSLLFIPGIGYLFTFQEVLDLHEETVAQLYANKNEGAMSKIEGAFRMVPLVRWIFTLVPVVRILPMWLVSTKLDVLNKYEVTFSNKEDFMDEILG